MTTTSTAVCLTGMERSFAEIGGNIREGLLSLLDASTSVTIFGVRPRHDPWSSLNVLLPMHQVETQSRCWSGVAQNFTIGWMHCDFRMRAGDCRLSFLQALCDLNRCEEMIAAHERKVQRKFDVIVRLRADLFWEARVAMRPLLPLKPNTVYVPAMDSQDGVNDHLAFGLREVMGRYMTRIRHIERSDVVAKLKGLGSEGYLGKALLWDTINVHKLQGWMYCPHTPRNLLRGSASEGCVGRVRCRVSCVSLYCPNHGIHAGECECLNVTCADFASGAKVAVLGVGSPNADKQYNQRRFTRALKTPREKRDAPPACTDIGGLSGSQLFHGCPPLPASPSKCGELCSWDAARKAAAGTASYYSPAAPSAACLYPTRALDPRLTRRPRMCSRAVYGRSFVEGGGRWPHSGTPDVREIGGLQE